MIETGPIILDIALVLIVAGTLGYLARKAGLPAILGYLFTGLLVSPFTPGYVTDAEQITLLFHCFFVFVCSFACLFVCPLLFSYC